MQEVSERIRRNWHPPKYKKSASVVVKLTIAKNGQLLDYKIIKSFLIFMTKKLLI